MLLGPKDLPDFSILIISDISEGTEGAMKKESPILLPMKSKGDFLVLGIFLVIS